MRAAIYARFSTDRQSESSIADQVRVCTEYAEQTGMTVCERFDDQGISGAAIGNRPGYARLREALLSRRFEAVIVTDLTRLSRSAGDLNKEIDRFVSRGVRIIGVQDGYDSARRGHKLQAGLSGIIGEAFREMVKDRTYAALETRARVGRPTGGKCYGYDRAGNVIEAEAEVVREIFEQFAQGQSCRSIAAGLNSRGIPSPGSSWCRKERRRSGWMGSAIRVILRNERYKGLIRWNTSTWVKDPDSGKRQRRPRPQSDWITQTDEARRIVSDDLFRRAQRRTRLGNDERLKAGGKPRYLLSGLLTCDECGSHYILVGPQLYGCSSQVNGRACTNSVRVRRDTAERVILEPLRQQLLAPQRVERMAREMQREFVERARAMSKRADLAPKDLMDLDQRISRLRARQAAGDPDMTPDELQVAIERAEAKRKELIAAQPVSRQSGTIAKALPQAAALYRQQIAAGLDGNPHAAAKARGLLREIFGGGKVPLVRQGDELWARIELRPAALLLRAVGTDGSGGRI